MVFRPRQTIVAPIGLVTQPNAYGVYPSGALKRADNVSMRNVGELVQMPGSQNTVSVPVSFTGAIPKLVALDNGHVVAVAGSSTAQPYADATGYTFQGNPTGNPLTSFSPTSTRICAARLAERLTLNSPTCCLVTDSMSPSTSGDRVFRRAGMLQPGNVGFSFASPGPVPDDVAVGYRVCFRRDFSDGYFVRSVPSPLMAVGNNLGASEAVTLTIVLSNTGLQAGDIVEVYRTDGVPITTAFMPSVGQTLKRIAEHPLTSAEVAGTFYTFTDTQEFVPGTTTTPGEELYTNPYQETEQYANRTPPVVQTLGVFKGYQFYGDTTDRPFAEFTCAGGIGQQSEAVAEGISATSFKANALGERSATGSRTSGSPTITGVSAADMVGIKPGQKLKNGTAGFPATTYVSAVNAGAGTITMDGNATSTAGATAYLLQDTLEINGGKFPFSSLPELAGALAAMTPPLEVSINTQAGALASGQSYTIGAKIRIEPALTGDNFYNPLTVRATNGANYSPALPEITATAKSITGVRIRNHLVWSKEQQPEHVPTAHEAWVGNGAIIALNPTRDALWIWCTDGLYRLSGSGGADGLGWGIDLVSTTLILAAPQASAVLGEIVYGYTNQGFVGVDSAGNIDYLTDQKIGNLLPGAQYAETLNTICEANETDDEVVLGLGENGGRNSHILWVYNSKQRGWTRLNTTDSAFRFVTAMAMQRSTSSGEPRLLFAIAPNGAILAPQYSGWNGSTYLQCAAEYQPIYGDDPLSLKQYIWCDFIFATGSNGKTLVPLYNSVTTGQVTITDFQNSGYARSGVPRRFAVAHSISAGFEQLAGSVQSRFQGISIAFNERTSQSKKR